MAWGAAGDTELTERAAEVAGAELAALGINLNFAPVADVLGDHRNPVLSTRCFSDDPRVVGEQVAAFIRGHQRAGVAATAKHFPGHGHTPVDSHVDLPQVDRSSSELAGGDMIPFGAAVGAEVGCMMISHVWYSALDPEPTPASTSSSVVRLAREDLAYDGVIVTDCLEMGAIRQYASVGEAAAGALAAGVDLAIISKSFDRQQEAIRAVVDAVEEGHLPVERLLEAHRRLDRLRGCVTHGGAPWPQGGPALAAELARRAVTLVRDADGIFPLRDEAIGVVSFAGVSTQVEDTEPRSMLGAVARERAEGVVEVSGRADVGDALRRLEGVKMVLVGTVRAGQDPAQIEFVRALLQARQRVVLIALRDPFDLLAIPDAPCLLAAYGEGEIEMRAAMDVLFGAAQPVGRLPVAIPGLYPRGHGMRAVPS
jgi:beta-N-acetylhexosaminidase